MNTFLRLRMVQVCMLVVFALVLLPHLQAQQTLGTIHGSVSDPSGAVLNDAVVIAVNNATSLTRTATTAKDGSYAFQNLPIGTYLLSVEHSGFEKAAYPNIRVQENRTTTLNVQLQPGQVSESVIVQGSPLLNSVDTTNGYVLDNAQMQQIPLATGSFTQLAILAPGANSQFINGTGTNEGLGNQSLWVNGQRATDNTFTVNGIDVSNLFNGNSNSQEPSGRVVPNTGENFVSGGQIQTNTSVYDAIGNAMPTPVPEMIQELSVNTSMYDSQQGQTSGAQIELSTMGGSNAWHGQGFFSHQTNWLNAAPFFFRQQSAQYGGPIPENEVNPELHRYNGGGTFGGPILRDKLFFFLGYNHIRVTDQFNGTSDLYLPAGLSDDRSIAGLTTAVQSSEKPGTPFSGNFDKAAVALLQAKLPGGQFLIPSVGSNAANLLTAGTPDAVLIGSPIFTADQATANLDYNASKSDVLSLKYYYQHDPSTNPFTDSQVEGFTQRLDAGSQVAAISNSYTPSSHLSWQQVFGFSREKAYSTNDQPFTPQSLGINLFGFDTFPGITLRSTNPTYRSSLNIGPTSDFFRDGMFQNLWAPSTTVISTLGKHTLTYGARYSYTQLNIVNRRQNTGQITFDSFADLAEGNVDTNRSSFLQGASSRYYRANYIGAFVQDKYQINPRLSLTAGIRYDNDGAMTEKYGNFFNFDPNLYSYDSSTDTITNDGFVVAGNNKQFHTPGVSNSTLRNAQWGISPRLGLAWSPGWNNGRVVFRSGFGMYFNRGEYFTYLSPGAGSGISGPFGVTQEPPFVVPFPSPSGATLSNPFGSTLPAPPTGDPQTFYQYLPNMASLETGAATYPFGSYDMNNKLPYTMNYTLDMQWQLRNDMSLDIAYVGNRGRHGVVPVPFNQPGIATPSGPIHGQTYSYGYQATDTEGNPLTTEPYYTYDGGNTDLRVPFIGYSVNSVTYKAVGVSAYDALQVQWTKRMLHGLQFSASYTWSHSLDEQSGLGLFYNGSNPLDLHSGYGSSDFDLTNNVTFSYVYQLPNVIKGHNWLAKVANGWGLEGITVLQSGQPYSVEDYSGTIAGQYYSTNDGITNPIVPLAPGVSPHQALTGHAGAFKDSSGNAIPALNSGAFQVPFVAPGQNGAPPCGVSTAGNPVCDVFETTFAGPGQRNIFRESAQKRADISLVKLFAATERVSFKYTFDVFNVTNTASFDIPNNSVTANSNYNNTPAYDPTLSFAANRQSIFSINNDNTLASGQGLGVVQQTIGSPRLISMSLHVLF
ncbi:carboxypeptidase regulatory-like domain-containing protein [Acidipila sp. 4G-K13]|uniref:TonB-dependent transporter Oar-like beta-barrel domain-containing protein n=2 Tax=Paracidobacterium acidisoli TaxID=2303751 RepID=A0A372IUR9_9BACT|nr:carboxypeptidase regulatory-like domain-containing protein [Paracidobacterium acidisoli]